MQQYKMTGTRRLFDDGIDKLRYKQQAWHNYFIHTSTYTPSFSRMTNRTAEEKIIDEKNFRIDANTSHFQYMADRSGFFIY